MKIAVMIPAIIDQECANHLVPNLRQKLIDNNKDFNFQILLNVDEYRREKCLGNFDSIVESYNKLNSENCSLIVTRHNPPLGLTMASKFLMQSFINSDCDLLMFLDDDCIFCNNVYISEFISAVNDSTIIHLAFAYDTCSSENPFITDKVFIDSPHTTVFYNQSVIKRTMRIGRRRELVYVPVNFCTENGTIFTRNLVGDLLLNCKFNIRYNPEDNFTSTASYQKCTTYTAAYKDEGHKIIIEDKPLWKLPKNNHFIVDKIRHYRKVGWNK